jgi:DNA repair protein RadA/Sms
VGVFEMVEGGLAAVDSPSELFLSSRNENVANAASAAVAVTMEGSRPILLEVQVLKYTESLIA